MTMAADPRPPTARPRSCWTSDGRPKVAYPSRADARRAARQVALHLDFPIREYHCACGAWHVTSQRLAERA